MAGQAVKTVPDVTDPDYWIDRERSRKEFHYAKCEGTTRRHRAAMRRFGEAPVTAKAKPKPTSLADVTAALKQRADAEAELSKALKGLPRGKPRWTGVKTSVDAGLRQAEVARLMGVGKTRIGQILAEDDCPF